MKKIYLIPVLVFVGSSISAQLQQVNNGSLDELVFYVGTNSIKYDEQALGSRYLDAEFVPARINEIEETQFVRFNAAENTIELKDTDDKVLTLSKSYNYSIKLLNGSEKTYETHSFIDEDGSNVISFFEKLYTSEKFALFLKERIIYIPAKKATSSYEQDVPGKFKKGNTIFYVTDLNRKSQVLFEFPKKKKELSILFEERTKSIQKFIKKEGLKMSKKEDIIAVLNFYFRTDK